MSRTDRLLAILGGAALGAVPSLAFAFLEWSVRAARHYQGRANTPMLPFAAHGVLAPHFIVEESRATAVVASVLTLGGVLWLLQAGNLEGLGVVTATFSTSAMFSVGARYYDGFVASALTGASDRNVFGGVSALTGAVFGGYAMYLGGIECLALTAAHVVVLLLFRRVKPRQTGGAGTPERS